MSQDANSAAIEALLYQGSQASRATESLPRAQWLDAARNKTIPLRITWPQGSEPCPVVIFSHGATGSRDGYLPLTELWARHGYICIQPTHEDSWKVMPQAQRSDMRNAFKHWDSRLADIECVLSSLEAIAELDPSLKGRMDRSRLALAGHSFGAYTCMLLGGATVLQDDHRQEFRTRHAIKALLLLSQQGPGKGPAGVLDSESWKAIDTPAMLVTGGNDQSLFPPREPAWRLETFEHWRASGDAYLLYLRDTDHGFGGITGLSPFLGAGPPNPLHVSIVAHTSLAFLDAYVLGDSAAQAYLTAGPLPAASAGLVEIKRK